MLHSRHRVTTVFCREAQASGHWWEGILPWVQLGSGWTLGGLGKVPLLGSGQGEDRAASDPELCLPRSLARPRAFCLPGRGKPGVPQPPVGSWLQCPVCVGVPSLPCRGAALPEQQASRRAADGRRCDKMNWLIHRPPL